VYFVYDFILNIDIVVFILDLTLNSTLMHPTHCLPRAFNLLKFVLSHEEEEEEEEEEVA